MPTTRITLKIDVYDHTVEQLQQLVANADALRDPVGIDPENVDTFDVLGHIYSGDLQVEWDHVDDEMETIGG